jgi:hypothetical protein
MKTRETTHSLNERTARAPRVASFAAEAAQKRKRPWGRRNPLIRLDSAKEIKGFYLVLFGRALLDEVRSWLDFDLACERFELNDYVLL